jgi:hypothetical protein
MSKVSPEAIAQMLGTKLLLRAIHAVLGAEWWIT